MNRHYSHRYFSLTTRHSSLSKPNIRTRRIRARRRFQFLVFTAYVYLGSTISKIRDEGIDHCYEILGRPASVLTTPDSMSHTSTISCPKKMEIIFLSHRPAPDIIIVRSPLLPTLVNRYSRYLIRIRLRMQSLFTFTEKPDGDPVFPSIWHYYKFNFAELVRVKLLPAP
ncbi:hypothetical protein BDP27DRAFT_930311 [Rhodocollybia butyracea]|uniref:Uncharacterized protein n=1 Tax=Rhodocollybia butyracea TaxID=206335 RepID=A0A9P5PSC1_9AGAR|nr:hypothetical protein BDP27DRAFT_930311 [Rhodocollybia butyracea]